MAKGTSGGAMNKHNSYQHGHNAQKYEKHRMITLKNKEKRIKAQKAFQDKKAAEKAEKSEKGAAE